MTPERRPNPDGSPDKSLEARLRALPRPPLPAGLEARLLAAIPTRLPVPRRRRAAWIGAAVAALAAGVLAILVWPRRQREELVTNPGTGGLSARAVVPSAGDTAWREARRSLEGSKVPAFAWPLRETAPLTVSTAIPPDLLE